MSQRRLINKKQSSHKVEVNLDIIMTDRQEKQNNSIQIDQNVLQSSQTDDKLDNTIQ